MKLIAIKYVKGYLTSREMIERQIVAIVAETESAHQVFHVFLDIFKPLQLGWVT